MYRAVGQKNVMQLCKLERQKISLRVTCCLNYKDLVILARVFLIGRAPACDRQTDRPSQTDGHPGSSYNMLAYIAGHVDAQ